MKYNELYTINNGVLAVLNEVQPVLYKTLFGETESTVLDSYAYFIASEKTFVPTFTSDTAKAILTGIFANYCDNWQKQYTALTSEYNAVKPVSTVETTNGTDTTDVVSNENVINSDKGFNSTDFVESDKTARTGDNNNARTYNETKND